MRVLLHDPNSSAYCHQYPHASGCPGHDDWASAGVAGVVLVFCTVLIVASIVTVGFCQARQNPGASSSGIASHVSQVARFELVAEDSL